MGELIRQVRKDGWETFMRFLDGCYGEKRGFFSEAYCHIYQPGDEYLQCFNVIEKDGKIVSHVGLYPLEVVADGVRITVGGIGGVATLPEERGKGHMAKLLRYVIREMEKRNWPLSWLGGDRQRYGNFGWELAGEKASLYLTERSLAKGGIKPSVMKEVFPEEAEAKVIELNRTLRFRVDREKSLGNVLRRARNRIWIGEDGYLCSEIENVRPAVDKTEGGRLVVSEVVSLSGKESSLIKAVMERCSMKEAEVTAQIGDTECFNRLTKVASHWNSTNEGMFRINNCFELLEAFTPILGRRASELNLKDFSISLGLRFGEKIDCVTVSYAEGVLHVSKEKTNPYVEIDERDGVRLLIGGPFAGRRDFGEISALFPLPVHIPKLDQV